MDLQGKDYLQVAHRLVWFREEHPDWSIQTDMADGAFRATIWCPVGNGSEQRIIACAHKSIGTKRYPLESAETGAVGRALAFVGYGTAHCGDELDEGDEIADSPTEQIKKEVAKIRAASEVAGRQNVVIGPEHKIKTTLDSNWVGGPTEAQLKRLYAISKRFGWTTEDVKTYLGSMGLESSKELNQLQYQKLCQLMEAYPKGGTDGGQDNGGTKSSD